MTDEHIFSNEPISDAEHGQSMVRADHVEIKQGGAGQVQAREVSLEQSGVGLARADSLHIGGNSGAFAVLADEAVIEEGGSVLFLLARNASGSVRPIVDLPTAIGIGAGFAVVLSLLRRLR